MKRFMKGFAVILTAAMAITFSACSLSVGSHKNPYEVAVDMGYDGTMGSWITETNASGTKEYRLYEEAKADGYEGSFVDFLKEIGQTSAGGIDGALMSTVSIVSSFLKETGNRQGMFGESSTEQFASAGSGVIYSLNREKGNAYLITNYHVVYSSSSYGKEKVSHISDDITVYLYGGEIADRGIEAEYVGGTMAYDLAVLKITDSEILRESFAQAAITRNSDTLSVGEDVYAVGNPSAQGISAVKGIVSVEAEYIDIGLSDGTGTTSLLEIRTDASINHGNSGGGLYDADGRFIGIVNARSEALGVEGFGYAIPSNLVLSVAQNIIDNSGVSDSHGALRAMLGITVQITDTQAIFDENTNKAYIMETVTVQSVEIGGIAFGKIHNGDVLYSVQIGNSDPIVLTRMHMLTNVMFNVRKGDTVKLTVSRGEGLATVEFTFSEKGDFTLLD